MVLEIMAPGRDHVLKSEATLRPDWPVPFMLPSKAVNVAWR